MLALETFHYLPTFSSISLCVAIWIISVDKSSSSLIFSTAVHSLLISSQREVFISDTIFFSISIFSLGF